MIQTLVNTTIQLTGQYYPLLLSAAGIMTVSFLLVIICKQKKFCKLKQKLTIAEQVLSCFRQDSVEVQLKMLLDVINYALEADGYYFYIFDQQKNSYILKTVKGKGHDLALELGYGGLVPYQEQGYHPPLGIEGPMKENQIIFTYDRGASLLEIYCAEGLGLIRAEPVTHISKKERELLNEICEKTAPLLHSLTAMQYLQSESEHIEAAGKVIQHLEQKTAGLEQEARLIMAACAQVIRAGGCCLAFSKDEKWEVTLNTNIMGTVEEQFYQDYQTLNHLFSLLESTSSCCINPESRNFYAIPYYFVAAGIESMFAVKVAGMAGRCMAVFWSQQICRAEKYQHALVGIITQRLGEIWDQHLSRREKSGFYIAELKAVVEDMENTSLYIKGHARQVAKYALVIAKQLKLRPDIRENIKLAAYFHDIGMVTVADKISPLKKRLTEAQYAVIKQHTVIGASLIHATIANEEIASYIRHHHENWDGYGYPQGLKAEQIPLGARIIAVAEQFTAKFEGRGYRKPLSFDQAVTELLAASGSLLDPVLVWALISWFKRKQKDSARSGLSLLPCWQMKSCTAKSDQDCAVYGKKQINCWETKGAFSDHFQRKCCTCIVYTEFLYREKYKTLEEESAVG